MRIFISYRREDCPAHAGRLYDALCLHFGDLSVFMDIEAIEPGVDFVETIERAVGSSDVVLALIGDDWLSVSNRDGARRIDDPLDFVRLELETALSRNDVRLIPVLVEGAEMPRPEELPDGLKRLSQRNAISLSDTGWRAEIQQLIRTIGGQKASMTGASLWMLPSFLFHGSLSLMFAGIRAKQRAWLKFGVLYSIPLLAVYCFALFVPFKEGSPEHMLIAGSSLLAGIAALIHIFVIRQEYMQRVGAPTSFSATPWVAPSFIGLGGPALVYAGCRTRTKTWCAFGVLYCVPTVVVAALPPAASLSALWILTAIVAFTHVMLIRPSYPTKLRQIHTMP